MKAITVCVDFSDILAITLKRNAPLFDSVIVVTTPEDTSTHAVVASVPNARCHLTRVFFDRGAWFNKGAALEEGFDVMGRDGWFVVMDSDILLPAAFQWPMNLMVGCLYTPRRRMLEMLSKDADVDRCLRNMQAFPLHPQSREWAGYFQLAHADDPVLIRRPWYPTSWVHAGGCDSEFQAKWPYSHKIRPPFEVLHVGPAGVNWCGRASHYTDGTRPENADAKIEQVRKFVRGRTHGPDRFRGEKL